MSTERDVIAPPQSHSTPKHLPKSCAEQNEVPKKEQSSSQRKSLQRLQQSASDDSALVGPGWPHSGKASRNLEKSRPTIRLTHGPVKVFYDEDIPATKEGSPATETKGTQTDKSLLEDWIQELLSQRMAGHDSTEEKGNDEAYILVTKEPVPEGYWKEIAEQRRLALHETLEENKSLHSEVESLREENEKLSELASQADYLSSLLQSVVSEDEESEENKKPASASQSVNLEAVSNEAHAVETKLKDSSKRHENSAQEPEHFTNNCTNNLASE